MAMTGTIVLLMLLAAAVYADVRRGKIYNALTVPAMAAGLALSAAGGSQTLQGSIMGLLAGLAAGGMLMALAHLGGGDAKLLMAVGALKGVGFLFASLAFGAVAGGLLAAAILVRQRALLRVFPTAARAAVQVAVTHAPAPRFALTGARMAYAPALAIGCLLALAL